MSTEAPASGGPRDTTRKPDSPQKTPVARSGNGSKPERLSLIGVKVNSALHAEIDEYAKAHGITRSRAAGQFLEIARGALRGREGVPAGKAEEILEALEGVRSIVELVGPPTFGLVRLLAHWATQSGGLKVSEDELLARAAHGRGRRVGAGCLRGRTGSAAGLEEGSDRREHVMFFVEARYHRTPEKVPQQIRYISHREERLPSGDRRELFGIGDRYRALRGDEKAIERAFAEDSKGLRRPAYFRFILTVDNRAAERFARLDGVATERAIRDAIERTFRGAPPCQ